MAAPAARWLRRGRSTDELTALAVDELLEPEEVFAVAEELLTNPRLTEVHLRLTGAGDAVAVAAAEALRVHDRLTQLHIHDFLLEDRNRLVSAQGAASIAEALRTNSSLNTLILFGSSIGDEGAGALAGALRSNLCLTTLDLTHSEVGATGVVALATALAANRSLLSLTLKCNDVGDRGAAALAAALRSNRSLTSLNLSNSHVGATGAVAVASALEVNSSLSTLWLDRNPVCDEGAAALARALRANTHLSSLGLTFCHITVEGAGHLAEALKVNAHLTTLDLPKNFFGEDGAALFARALEVNGSLAVLNLSGLGHARAVEIKTLLARNDKSREMLRQTGGVILLQLTLLPEGSPNDPPGLAVTTMGGTELLRMPLQRTVKLQDVYSQVRLVRDVPRSCIRWVLPDGQVVEYLGGVPVVEALTAAATRANQAVVTQTALSTG